MTVGTALVVCSAEGGGRKGWKHWAWGRHFGNLGKSLFVYIQMYDKITHTNVWQKHAYKNAYKCMTKTGIQTHLQIYDKNAYKFMTKTHTNVWQKHAYKCMKKNRHSTVWQGRELPRFQLSAHQSFFWVVSGDWTANPLVIGRPHSPLRHSRPKGKLRNLWKKQAYKCIKKNRHTNVWQKHAYKWLTKTRIQMYEKNPHSNVWKESIQTRIKMYEKKQAYKCMTKTHTNVWQKHAYK